MLRFGGMGLELAGGIVGFLLLGYWVDYACGTGPIGVVTGSLLGCVGGMFNMIRRAVQMSREDERERRGKTFIHYDDAPSDDDDADNQAAGSGRAPR